MFAMGMIRATGGLDRNHHLDRFDGSAAIVYGANNNLKMSFVFDKNVTTTDSQSFKKYQDDLSKPGAQQRVSFIYASAKTTMPTEN